MSVMDVTGVSPILSEHQKCLSICAQNPCICIQRKLRVGLSTCVSSMSPELPGEEFFSVQFTSGNQGT